MKSHMRGVFEKEARSGEWWIRYVDAQGRYHREKAGTKRAAVDLYRKRKTEALEGRKLPERLRRSASPSLRIFSDRFLQSVRTHCAAKPRTIEFYTQQTKYLLAYDRLANRAIDEIDEALVEEFAQARRTTVKSTTQRTVGIATTNRGLAVLRRMLRLAHEWRVIDRVPKIRLLRGERSRDFVLDHQQEGVYLEFAPKLLHDATLLMLDTGLGPAEALGLEWRDIHDDYLEVREGKSRYRARRLNLTMRVGKMLNERRREATTAFVFPGNAGKPFLASSLAHLHSSVRHTLKLPPSFVLYSLRHTALTRLGEAGADAFTIMRIAGHSSITTSQRYVHPSSEATGLAIARLDSANQRAAAAESNRHHSSIEAEGVSASH